MQATHATLKERHRRIRDGMPEALNLRIHRSLSWLQRAAQCSDDADGRFVFLWIAFNAAYAHEIPQGQRLSEQEAFRAFLQKLHGLDTEKQLAALVWKEFSGPIRVLLDNPYVFESFWNFHRGELSEEQWQERFTKGKRRAHRLLETNDTPELLALVFQRIYTLRQHHGQAGARGD